MPRTKAFDESRALARAVDLFWAKGYASTSMQDLVDTLGLSRSSIYDTWGDKHTLFIKAFEQYRDTNSQRVEELLGAHHDVRQGLRALLSKSVSQTSSDPKHKGCFIVNATAELASADAEMHEMLKANREHFERIFQNYLLKGVESGQLSKTLDTRAVASTLFTFYSGLNVIGKINPDTEGLLSSVDTLLGILEV